MVRRDTLGDIMQTQWTEWLAAERAAGRSGVVLNERPIVRGKAYELVLPIPGDLTGATFAASLHVSPGASAISGVSFDTDLAAFDAEAGTTTLTLSLAATETDTELPADGNLDGLAEVIFKLDFTPSGGDQSRALGLVIPIVE
jgi:hypothetical protein